MRDIPSSNEWRRAVLSVVSRVPFLLLLRSRCITKLYPLGIREYDNSGREPETNIFPRPELYDLETMGLSVRRHVDCIMSA